MTTPENLELLSLGYRRSPELLYTVGKLRVGRDYTLMPGRHTIEHETLTVAVNHFAACLFDDQHPGADIPFMDIAKGQRAIAITAADAGKAIGDAADGLDGAAIDKNLKALLRLRTTHQ